MTAQEKWARLRRPTCVEDYGLSMSQAEMRRVPELRHVLARIKAEERRQRKIDRMVTEAMEMAAQGCDGVIREFFEEVMAGA